MVFYHPIWIILAVPMLLVLYVMNLSTRLLNGLRCVVVILLVLALCRPAIRLPGREGTVVVVADRSESIPPEKLSRQRDMIELVRSGMGESDKLAVVAFGREAVLERAPQAGPFGGFISEVGPDQSSLCEGLDLALSLVPRGDVGRLLVLSDGRWTGRDPAAAAMRAAMRGIPIDHRVQERSSINDVAVQRVEAPQQVAPGEAYIMTGWIVCPVQQEVSFEFRNRDRVLAAGKRNMAPGLNRLLFRDIAEEAGTRRYTLTVSGTADDPLPENNRARVLVGVAGTRPLLCLTYSEQSGLAGLLRKGRLDIKVRRPAACRWTLEDLSGYSGVLVENVSANDIGSAGMENIAAWVEKTGNGLMLTGGGRSYGPGGYFKSPLDRIIPVSMELRQEHRKFSLAMVIALDRSGSMAASAGGGKTKMDLANIGSAQVLDLLSDNDEIGVIAVDSMPHTVVEMNTVARNRSERRKILSIESMGGGIFVYEALVAAAKMLSKSQAGTRHIILFADAADSEEPGGYVDLLKKCAAAGITVSVVGLGTVRDCDAGLLKDIAKRGNGQCFFTDKPREIPRLFAQDTFSVARSSFVEDMTPLKFTAGFATLSDALPETLLRVAGYNLCYLKPAANLAVVTVDEYKAPVVASWQAGSGRVLCYTGEADGKFTGPIAKWAKVGDFFTSLARWTIGDPVKLPRNMMLTQRMAGGICRIELHLDPERDKEPFTGTPTVSILRGESGSTPTTHMTTMYAESADLLVGEVPLAGRETALATVEIPRMRPVVMSPVCLPYSPEFKPPRKDRGVRSLDELASATGGGPRTDLAGIWGELPTHTRLAEISHWLLLLAAGVFLLEILQRRTGAITARRVRFPTRAGKEAEKEEPARKAGSRRRARRKKEAAQPVAPEAAEAGDGTPPGQERKASHLDAMRRARERARRRTDR